MTVVQLVFTTLARLTRTKPTGVNVYQAINAVSVLITKRLLRLKSDLAATYDMQIEVTPASQNYDLPAGFVSLSEKPWLPEMNSDGGNGGSYPYPSGDSTDGIGWLDQRHGPNLEPISKPRSYYQQMESMYPIAYEILGTQIIFYPKLPTPPPTTPVTVIARYYGLPSVIASAQINGVDLHIPYNGLFDQVYEMCVPRVIIEGIMTIQSNPEVVAFINSEIDSVMAARSVPLPDRRMTRRNWL